MKPTGMHAYRKTADSIWSSFLSSGKRHLILTGSRGSGKTTLLRQIFPQPLPGLTTWAQPGQAVYLQDNLTREAVQVGVFDATLPGPGNQMAPLQDGFASFGAAALMRCIASDSSWIAVDEIGYLESQCAPYHEALRRLMEKKQLAAAVRKQDLPFLRELCSRGDVFVVDLDDPYGNIGCVVMASGLGKRFGGNKLLADFHGSPMILRILDATEGIFAQRVVVTRSREIAALCDARGIRAVLHSLPHRSDTVHLGLEAMPGIDRCMFVPSDQPLLRADTVAAVALASANDPDSIWRPVCGDVYGAPVVFPRWAFSALLGLQEGNGGSAVIRKNPERLRTVSVRDPYELRDADSPEELSKLLGR